MDRANLELLERELLGFGVQPSWESIEAIGHHLDLVAEWNQQINLTAITTPKDMVLKHAVDSALALLSVDLKPGARVVDVGTGAGFPGVTLKCLVPDIDLVLLESLGKRCKFLESVGTEVLPRLGVEGKGYQVLWSRAEDAGQAAAYREQFDVVVARAVADLRVLSELCLPLCRVGGAFLAMKGPSLGEELGAAERAIALVGGKVEEVREVDLPEGAGTRTLVRIRKVKPTPKAYPRKAGTPGKSPL